MKRFFRLAILPSIILLAGFALRLYHLGAASLWYDETVSVTLAQSDVAELIRHTAADIHPPFYYLLLHFWGLLTGWSEFSAAWLSLLFGVLLIALVYRVGRALWPANRRVAEIAALLVAVSPYNVWYSQEVRMYTLGATLGLASVYLLWRILRAPRVRSWHWLGYVFVTVLGIYTLYYFIFLIAFEYVLVAAYWIATRPALKRLSSFILSQFSIAVLYLFWLPIAFRQATDPPVPPWRTATPLVDSLLSALSALALGESVDPRAALAFLVLVIGLIVYLFFRLWQERNAEWKSRLPLALALAGYTLVPLLLILLASVRTPLYHPRYVFTYSPAFYILLALAVDKVVFDLARRRTRVQAVVTGALLGVLVLASGYSLDRYWFDPINAEDDLRGAVAHLAENWRPGDVILVNAGYTYTALAYYAPDLAGTRARLSTYMPAPGDADARPLLLQTGSIGGSARLGWGDPRSDFYPTTADETRAALDRVFAAHPRVWMLRLYDTVTDPEGAIRSYFAEHARLIDDSAFSGQSNVRVQGYLTGLPQSLPSDATRVQAPLADRVMLLGYRGPRLAFVNGRQRLDVVLYWQLLQPVNYNYQCSVQVLGPAGNVVAQHDEKPLGGALATTRWKTGEIYPEPISLDVAALPPGTYTVIAKLYNLDSGEVLGNPIPLREFSK